MSDWTPDEQRLVDGGARRAAVAAAWGVAVGAITLVAYVASLVFTYASIVDWWGSR